MQKLQRWLEKLYNRRIKQEFDAVVPVIGDEGMGKSTLMLTITMCWQDIQGMQPTTDSVLDRIVWDDRDEFKRALSESPERAAIPVSDAARVLYRKDAMVGAQKEIEKDLLDVRIKENLILLGFQDFDIIPSMVQKRRAKHLLYIPRRGVVWGYSRAGIDERLDDDSWPQPQLKDTFPSLESTPLWDQFRRLDREKKLARMHGTEEVDEEDDGLTVDEIVDELTSNGELEDVITIHGTHNYPYIDADLVRHKYGVSHTDAKTVAKLLNKDDELDLEAVVAEA